MVRIVSIKSAKGASMVCSQCLVSNYQRSLEFDHGDVFIYIHGIQMRTDHWDFRAVLSWVALLLADGARWDLSWLYSGFGILAPGPFRVGRCGCRCGGWSLQTGWRVRLDRDGLHQG